MGRYLKRNHGTETPTNLIFVDTESYKEVVSEKPKITRLRLRLWCATRVRLEKGLATRRKEEYGTDAESFWRFVHNNSDSQRCTWIFAHKAFHDLTQLDFWRELDEGRFTVRPMISKQPGTDGQSKNSWIGKLCIDENPFFCQVRNGQRTYKFVDTLNYWQMSLKALGKSVGLDKLECDPTVDSMDIVLPYCKRDTEIIERAVCQLITKWKETDAGVFQPTSALLALTNFRHTCDIKSPGSNSVDLVCQPDSAQNVLERESYYGGRIQAFYVGELHQKIYHLDCNSLYPFVMRSDSYPRRFVKFLPECSLEKLYAISRVYGVVARVLIRSRYDAFPCRIDGKQYHINGQFWTSLCSRELARAIQSGSVLCVGTTQVYSVAPLFRKWVDYWYDRKVEADRIGPDGIADRTLAKLLLNSLSGKWAQHGRKWRDEHGEYPQVRWGPFLGGKDSEGNYKRQRGIGGNCQTLDKGRDPDHAFPAISAFITANAREYMRSVISICPDNSVYYMATDSLICNSSAYDALEKAGFIDDTDLGKFKIVGEHKYANIFGPNDYILDSRQVASGRIAKARADLENGMVSEQWDKVDDVICKGPTSDIQIKEFPCHYAEHTNRGRIGPDGWWTPYRITDDITFTDRPRRGGYFVDDWPDMVADRIPQDV